jgi:hypothetical protein
VGAVVWALATAALASMQAETRIKRENRVVMENTLPQCGRIEI